MTLARAEDHARSAASTGGIAGDRAISIWLWGVAALVIAMVVVGGATRLTESGLSITEWQPLLGAIPPLT
ncbi:MAG TPA: COX15/CtaA family protein, partial [Hyphomicrobium sp.]|nr:COX15/CtaA family protein [Hyphomicrobium sp.]